jgi:demethylmenaquinone methyltransferase/2-methoxy-6-polyprenyl-1,4-benzoquinol methylase
MDEGRSGPDRAAALEQYRRAAPSYDRHMRRGLRGVQRAAVEALSPAPGQTILDIACGTGLNFEAIVEAVGPRGVVVGVDLSPEMLAVANERVREHGWTNVELVEAAVEQAEMSAEADGALFSFSHDVLQAPRAVANVVAHLRPGARVASAGGKLGARWNIPVNLFVRRAAKPFMTTFDGLERPWRELERYTDRMTVRDLMFGGAYVACGEVTAVGHGAARAAQAGTSS